MSMTAVRRAVLLGALVALGAKGAPDQVPLTKAGPANNVQVPPATNQSGATANEIDSALMEGDADGGGNDDGDSGGAVVNRSLGHGPGAAVNAPGRSRAKSNPEIQKSFEGLNLHDQRFA